MDSDERGNSVVGETERRTETPILDYNKPTPQPLLDVWTRRYLIFIPIGAIAHIVLGVALVFIGFAAGCIHPDVETPPETCPELELIFTKVWGFPSFLCVPGNKSVSQAILLSLANGALWAAAIVGICHLRSRRRPT